MSGTARFWAMLAVLVSSAMGFYVLRHGKEAPPLTALSRLPMQLGDWQAVNVPLDESIVKAAGVDDYVSRSYLQNDGAPVLLYVGYYRSQRTGDTIHSPKNCLPGAGWQPVESNSLALRNRDGHGVQVNRYVIQKKMDRQLVLYWYQSHGRVIASEYSAKIYLVADAIRWNRTDGALVRVTTPVIQSPEESQRRAVAFAQELLPALDRLLP